MQRGNARECPQFVQGYTIVNDFGVHDFRHADRGAMVRVKGQDGFCPMGPVMVDAGDVNPKICTYEPLSTVKSSKKPIPAAT